MKRTQAELLDLVKVVLGDRTDDDALKLIEDVKDSTEPQDDGEDWKKKYEDLDKTWREKYRARFFEGTPDKKKEDPDDKPKDDDGDGVSSGVELKDLFEGGKIDG